MRRYQGRKSRRVDSPAGGEDSFLDIVSNMVGILIILVMIAGTRVGDILTENSEEEREVEVALSNPTELSDDFFNEPGNDPAPLLAPPPATLPEKSEEGETLANSGPPKTNVAERRRYLQATAEFEKRQEAAASLKREVDELNGQMERLTRQTEGVLNEHAALMSDKVSVEALIGRDLREKDESEKESFRLQGEVTHLSEEMNRLKEMEKQLAEVRPKATVLENIPTPLSKKVEGAEGFFALKEGRISHVPIGECSERVRGYFRSTRDWRNNQIDDVIGPIEGYRFHFQGSFHQVRDGDAKKTMVVFDYGEFIPVVDHLGEPVDQALAGGSEFFKKLALYLKESSVITLSVWPDSFTELRPLKKYLLQNGYTIALRPMPEGKNIVISPNGTASTTY